MALTPGSRLGPYEIIAPLGAGGMGEVYRARDTRLERTVAIKVLPQHLSSSPEVRQRFEREAKTISQLSHPHICALYDVGREGETEYLVMEYLEGGTLSDRLGKGALPLEQTLRYGTEIADALDKAHRQGIVHRDLKPGNVMLTKSGVKLLDFGLAKAMVPAEAKPGLTSLPTAVGAQNLTQEGTILGTFQYMAPEQLEGKEADARTDIFAFGAVLYEMATGKKAFSGATPGLSDLRDHEGRAGADLDRGADGTAGARPRRAEMPRQGSGGPLAKRGGPRQRIEVDRRGLAGRRLEPRGREAAVPGALPVDRSRRSGRGRRVARARGPAPGAGFGHRLSLLDSPAGEGAVPGRRDLTRWDAARGCRTGLRRERPTLAAPARRVQERSRSPERSVPCSPSGRPTAATSPSSRTAN